MTAPKTDFNQLSKILVERKPGHTGLSIDALNLLRPTLEPMVADVTMTLKPGDRAILTGPSGCGKSTILRAICGLWAHGNGTITMPADAKTLCIAQKTYMPLTALKGILCYPDHAKNYSDETALAALTAVGLGNLAEDLNNEDKDGTYWSRLSGGEQQRISFARALIQKPDILMMDEVTSALNVEAQDELYRLIVNKLPDAIIISVSHRREIMQFHNLHGRVNGGKFTLTPLDTGGKASPPPPAPV